MNLKRFVSIVISVAILFVIYTKIDLLELIDVFKNCDGAILAIAIGMVIPITLITSWRLQQLVPRHSLKFLEANRLILGASVLNMVLPSKMGDIVKAYFMSERSNLSLSLAIAISIFEKACDLLSLLLWCVFGLFLYDPKDSLFWSMTLAITAGLIGGILLLSSKKIADLTFDSAIRFAPKSIQNKLEKMQRSWLEMHQLFWHDKQKLLLVSGTSIFIWLLHLLQIWLFIISLKAVVPFITSLALSPLAILAGLLPLTFAGIGTRDAAIVYFYQDYFSSVTGAALGLLCTSRYFIPALIGLPFLGQMMAYQKKRVNNQQ